MTEFSILDFVTSICINRDWSSKSNVFMNLWKLFQQHVYLSMKHVIFVRFLIHGYKTCLI